MKNIRNNAKFKKINRKLKKLKNDPKLFFKDLLHNKNNDILNFFYKRMPKKYGLIKRYTIVSAVYNVADYLDDFIESVVNQRLDFETNIELILVDDGSKDASRDVIQKWVRRYPKNIFYFWKKNGGQSTARNFGLQYVRTEWVTFVDPDDFLDINYFLRIDDINSSQDSSLVITKFKLYKEKFGTYHDGFQTDFCFSDVVRKVTSSDMENCVQFSSSSSVYRSDVIFSNQIKFDERLTASFEDTKFFYEYVSRLDNENIFFLRDAIYYYRLRANESSSSNGQWKKKAKYKQFFEFGVIEVAEIFREKYGYIPAFIQRMILFSVIPYLQVGSISPNRITSVLDKSEISELLENIEKSLAYVEIGTIQNFYDSPGNYFWISVILSLFKGHRNDDLRVYVNKVDPDLGRVYFRFYAGAKDEHFSMKLNDSFVAPVDVKVVKHQFLGKAMIYEFNVSYEIGRDCLIDFEVGEYKAKIYTDFKMLYPGQGGIYDSYEKRQVSLKDVAIFVDSGYKADDNAEHLYRLWCLKDKKIKNLNFYYLLDKDSNHWDRLKKEGFNLVNIDSVQSINLLKSSKYIFSSYLPGHLNSWVKNHNFKFQKFIFLQHGVVTSNLSKPFNAYYSQIYKMIVSTFHEKNEVLSEDFNYIFQKDDIIESGIPRMVPLFEKNEKIKKSQRGKSIRRILVCPTWRTSLSAISVNENKKIDEVMQSEYMVNWLGLLKLPAISSKKDVEVSFCLHPNMYQLMQENPLLKDRILQNIGSNVRLIDPGNSSYQQLFLDNDLLITDYSSLHFDFAFIGKPVVYFQFDQKDFYGATHAYSKSSFDFSLNGFGPVVQDINSLNELLNYCVAKRNNIFEKYVKRGKEIFLTEPHDISDKIYNEIF